MKDVMFLHKLKARVASLICLSLYAILHQPLLAEETAQATPLPLPNVYEKIVQAHLPSLTKALLDEEKSQKEISTANRIKNNDAELLNFNSPIKEVPLGNVETYRLLCGIFQKHYAQEVGPFIADTTLSDLELFCGSSRTLDRHIFGSLDNTITALGKIELQKMLIMPITDSKELQRRQKLIKQLAENPELIKSLDKSLQQIKQCEADFAWFWKQTDEFFEASLQRMYWEKTPLIDLAAFNKSIAAQGLNALQVTGYNPTFTYLLSATPLMLITLFCIGTILLTHTPILDTDIVHELLEEGGQRSMRNIRELIDGSPTIKVMFYLGIIGVQLSALFIFYFINGITIAHAKSYNNTSNAIHKKMNGIAQYLQALQDIKESVFTQTETLALATTDKNSLESLTYKDDDEKKKLCTMLSAWTFKMNPSIGADKGSVLVAFKIMHEVKDRFIDVIRTVGTLDAYLSLAKLYKQDGNVQQNRYCLVDYETQETPHITLKGLWHPLDSSLSSGPQATALAIIMAHTCGIAPAQEMRITPHATFLSNLLTEIAP